MGGYQVIIAGSLGSGGAVTGYMSLTSSNSFNVPPTGTNALSRTVSPSVSSLIPVSAIDLTSYNGAQAAISIVDGALTNINAERAKLGALQSRFEQTISNLQTGAENLSASRSRIQDADFAMETAALARAQILQQAGMAMVAQANQLPQQVMALLK